MNDTYITTKIAFQVFPTTTTRPEPDTFAESYKSSCNFLIHCSNEIDAKIRIKTKRWKVEPILYHLMTLLAYKGCITITHSSWMEICN